MKTFFESLLSRWLAMDPESAVRMTRLHGKVVHFVLLGISVDCQMIFERDDIKLRWENFLPADLRISATPLRLLQLRMSRERRRFFSDDVMVSGDMMLAREVMALFDELEPDWEEWLANKVGDVSAHQMGRFFRKAGGMLREVAGRLSDSLSEYLQEEVGLTPPREAIQDFYEEVDSLRLQVDRLQARIQYLQVRS